jgi:hypothetical protein
VANGAREAAPLRLRSAAGRWAIAATVLGSGAVFVESTVVSVALPAVGRDLASWRWVFASAVPLALVGWWIVRAHVAAPAPGGGRRRADAAGARLVSTGLGALVRALIEGPKRGATPVVITLGALGIVLIVAFLAVQARRENPLLPLAIFRSRQFSGANATTLLVYAAAGLALFSRVGPGSRYLVDVPPATLVLGAGLGTLVAPLTAWVLAVAEEGRTGIASAVNNATARLAGLLATALVPLAVGIAGLESFTGPAFAAGFRRAMLDLGRPLRGGRGPGLAHRARGHRERLRAAPKPGTFTDDLSWSGLPEPT